MKGQVQKMVETAERLLSMSAEELLLILMQTKTEETRDVIVTAYKERCRMRLELALEIWERRKKGELS